MSWNWGINCSYIDYTISNDGRYNKWLNPENWISEVYKLLPGLLAKYNGENPNNVFSFPEKYETETETEHYQRTAFLFLEEVSRLDIEYSKSNEGLNNLVIICKLILEKAKTIRDFQAPIYELKQECSIIQTNP